MPENADAGSSTNFHACHGRGASQSWHGRPSGTTAKGSLEHSQGSAGLRRREGNGGARSQNGCLHVKHDGVGHARLLACKALQVICSTLQKGDPGADASTVDQHGLGPATCRAVRRSAGGDVAETARQV